MGTGKAKGIIALGDSMAEVLLSLGDSFETFQNELSNAECLTMACAASFIGHWQEHCKNGVEPTEQADKAAIAFGRAIAARYAPLFLQNELLRKRIAELESQLSQNKEFDL